MSTQETSGVQFSILPEQDRQHYRLLELPSELLSLLTSDDPPLLQFKSPEQRATGSPDFGAVICTPDKTYNIRQVNTSNSVYICQPTSSDADNDYLGIPQSALQAIAESSFTLELSPSQTASAVSSLKALLPIYSATSNYQAGELSSRPQIFDNIPLSQAECKAAWIGLACFELSDPAGSFLPSASAKLQAWRSIYQQALASDIHLTAALPPHNIDLVINGDEECPAQLSLAVLSSLSNPSDVGVALDKQRCVRGVGLIVISAAREGRRLMTTAQYLQSWKDLLPEAWRSEAELSTLPRAEYMITGNTISFVGEGAKGAAATASQANPTLGGKRKWHDKFRASKKSA